MTHPIAIAQAVRSACVAAALEGYERAQISGLCQEGAWEVAVDAIRMVDLKTVLQAMTENRPARCVHPVPQAPDPDSSTAAVPPPLNRDGF
ncbi:MAG: acetyltransferase [Rhodocyclaceae bacterium]|nr:MAG: acetyltransferase [Rhodocyclaceae bacterium]TND00948.1 MAG: acetyltransferase [Rhodocyclaceae bacterium]